MRLPRRRARSAAVAASFPRMSQVSHETRSILHPVESSTRTSTLLHRDDLVQAARAQMTLLADAIPEEYTAEEKKQQGTDADTEEEEEEEAAMQPRRIAFTPAGAREESESEEEESDDGLETPPPPFTTGPEKPVVNTRSKALRVYLLWLVCEMRLDPKLVFSGLSISTYYRWLERAADNKLTPRKSTGRKRKLTPRTAAKLVREMKQKKHASTEKAAEEYPISSRTARRYLRDHRVTDGLRPIRRKRGAKRRTDRNQPRIYDMAMGFAGAFENSANQGKYAFADEFPIKFGKGDHSGFCYAEVGEEGWEFTPYRYESASAIMCISESPPKIVRADVQKKAYAGDDCYLFYSEEKRNAKYEHVGGAAVAELLEKLTDAEFFFHDLLGNRSLKGHLHPDIHRIFAAHGIREILLCAQGHYFNPQEVVNRAIQQKIRTWLPRRRRDAGDYTYGPQSWDEVLECFNDVLASLREADEKGDTLEARIVRNAFHERGGRQYFDKMCENVQGRYADALKVVHEKHDGSGEVYTVPWNPLEDGGSILHVTCLNKDMPNFDPVGHLEKRRSKNEPPRTERPSSGPGASIFVNHGLRSRRETVVYPAHDAEPVHYKNFVFKDHRDDGCEPIYGKIVSIEDGTHFVFKQIRKSLSTLNQKYEVEDFKSLLDMGDIIWMGEGSDGVKNAKEAYNDAMYNDE